MVARFVYALCLIPLPLMAQQPLSAIDWLENTQPANTLPEPNQATQPEIRGVVRPDISVTPLDEVQSDSVGLLPSSVTGLPVSIWRNSQTRQLISQLERLSMSHNPAIQQLTFSLMLAEADAPSDSNGKFEFLAARVNTLIDYGAIDPALALVERAAPLPAPLVPLLFDLSLLTDALDPACDQVLQLGSAFNDDAARIYCIARKGDWLTAVLILETAEALDSLSPRMAALMHLFLETDIDDVLAANMPPPLDPSPLEFRIYEAIGEPLNPASLDRAYSVSQLSGENGWNSQLRAAERLAETGALSDNRLLGIYTSSEPSASGGVWERVRMMRTLENALKSNDSDQILTTFKTAKAEFDDAQLLAPFARLFMEQVVEKLGKTSLDQDILETAFLTPNYESFASLVPKDATRELRFKAAIARGDLGDWIAGSDLEESLVQAFQDPQIHHSIQDLLSQGRLGEVILTAIAQFDRGAAGDLNDLKEAISIFRYVGLEDTARRATLSYLLGY